MASNAPSQRTTSAAVWMFCAVIGLCWGAAYFYFNNLRQPVRPTPEASERLRATLAHRWARRYVQAADPQSPGST